MNKQPGTNSVADINPEDIESMTILTEYFCCCIIWFGCFQWCCFDYNEKRSSR